MPWSSKYVYTIHRSFEYESDWESVGLGVAFDAALKDIAAAAANEPSVSVARLTRTRIEERKGRKVLDRGAPVRSPASAASNTGTATVADAFVRLVRGGGVVGGGSGVEGAGARQCFFPCNHRDSGKSGGSR